MKECGFTLIETIIYIAVLAFLIGSGIAAAFYIIDSSEKNKSDVNLGAEAHFLLRKIDWALSSLDYSSSPIADPAAGTFGFELSVNKSGGDTITIDAPAGRGRISVNGASPVEITNDRVQIQSLIFDHIAAVGSKPAAIHASFTAGGQLFEITRYLRK